MVAIDSLQSVAKELPLPDYVHAAAFFIFGLTGGLAAVKRHYDFIGLFVMSFATAAGGGLIRDGLFIQDGPPLITHKTEYILVIAASAICSVLFRKHILRLSKLIAWLDAFGVAVYTIVGTQIALVAGLSTAAAVIVGVICAAGGGLLRDILTGEEPLMLKPGQFYILAALTGCVIYILCLSIEPWRSYAAILSISVTVIFRILAIQFNWSTSPVSRWDRLGGGETM